MTLVPLKNKTAWDHLRTLKRAVDTVKSWPKWKRDFVVYREKAERGEGTR